jgi:hypothetical protein
MFCRAIGRGRFTLPPACDLMTWNLRQCVAKLCLSSIKLFIAGKPVISFERIPEAGFLAIPGLKDSHVAKHCGGKVKERIPFRESSLCQRWSRADRRLGSQEATEDLVEVRELVAGTAKSALPPSHMRAMAVMTITERKGPANLGATFSPVVPMGAYAER